MENTKIPDYKKTYCDICRVEVKEGTYRTHKRRIDHTARVSERHRIEHDKRVYNMVKDLLENINREYDDAIENIANTPPR